MNSTYFTSAVFLNTTESTAEAADKYLIANFGDCEFEGNETPLWGSAGTDEFDRAAFANGKPCVKVAFKRDENLRKFLLWCRFNDVKVYAVLKVSDYE